MDRFYCMIARFVGFNDSKNFCLVNFSLKSISAELHLLEVVRLCSLFRACLLEFAAHSIAMVASATSRPFSWWSNRLSRPRNEFRAGNRTHMGSAPERSV